MSDAREDGCTPRQDAREIMDVEGVAAYLGFAPSTIYNRVQQRDIPHVRLGNSLRFPKAEIDRWLARQTVKPAPSLYEEFVKMSGRFFFERWLETRAPDPKSVTTKHVVDWAEEALKDLKDRPDGQGSSRST